MTAAEFQSIRPLLKLSDERIEAARAALVDGETLQAVGDRYGWTRQAAGDAVSAVWRTLESYREGQQAAASAGTLLPPGWEQVTLIAPSHLIERFRNEIAQAAPLPVAKAATRKKAVATNKQ
jgi:hypothetical protein